MPFHDIAGHRLTLRLLARAVAKRSLPPSLLFAGARGVGKHRTAVALAQALNCLSPRSDVVIQAGATGGETTLAVDACGSCAACSRIARGIHPDVMMLAPDPDAGNIKIEAVRELIDRVGYRPFEGRWRVVIIDDADTLVDAAQNALLKTLEEPPSVVGVRAGDGPARTPCCRPCDRGARRSALRRSRRLTSPRTCRARTGCRPPSRTRRRPRPTAASASRSRRAATP